MHGVGLSSAHVGMHSNMKVCGCSLFNFVYYFILFCCCCCCCFNDNHWTTVFFYNLYTPLYGMVKPQIENLTVGLLKNWPTLYYMGHRFSVIIIQLTPRYLTGTQLYNHLLAGCFWFSIFLSIMEWQSHPSRIGAHDYWKMTLPRLYMGQWFSIIIQLNIIIKLGVIIQY